MYAINGTNIQLTRGDSLYLTINATQDGDEYIPVEGDMIRFAMKQRYSDTDPILVKNIPTDTMTLHILPEDTSNLTMKTTYVYDIQLTRANGDVDTFIKGTFLVGEEVL